MIGLLFVSVVRAACESTPIDPTARLDAAEAAYGRDLPAFVAAVDALRADVDCWSVPLAPATAARVHRVVGLRAFVDKDMSRAAYAFAAARSVDGAYQFPEALVPPGHPVRSEYDAIDLVNGKSEALPPAGRGQLWFDGTEGPLRPARWPTIGQWTDGVSRTSAYLWPGEPVFAYPLVAPVVAEPRAEAGRSKRWVAPIATLAGAGLAYGAAYGVATVYRTGEHDLAARNGLRAGANGLVIASGVLALTGVGLGVAAAF